MITESFLVDTASFFFAVWILIICTLILVAFAPDLLPSKVNINRFSEGRSSTPLDQMRLNTDR